MKRWKIAEILGKEGQQLVNTSITVKGWVRAFRSNRFIQLNDGSCMATLQAVVDFEKFDETLLKRITTASALSITGTLIESIGSGQSVELQVEAIEILGDANPDDVQKTVMQPKRHSLEFLREQAHLRFRTNTFGAVFRIRHHVSYAIHSFFNDRGFFYLHTPIITGSDAEGAGEMFRVTNLDAKNPPLNEDGSVNFKEDFFGKPVNLTVSGQLEAELAALALGQVYTFGPTFRAENSNTSRHLAEFWMIEPEVAFNDLKDNMDLTEDFLKHICSYILETCSEDLKFLNDRESQEQAQKPQNERNELLQQVISLSIPKKIDGSARNYFIKDISEIIQIQHLTAAWLINENDGSIFFDRSKGLELKKSQFRFLRKPILEKLDVEFMKALEVGNSSVIETIIVKKQILRDITNIDMSQYDTPQKLHEFIPDVLKS